MGDPSVEKVETRSGIERDEPAKRSEAEQELETLMHLLSAESENES